MRARLKHSALPGLLLGLTGALHPWLEATMARHMLLELTLLFAACWLAEHATGASRHRPALKAYYPAALQTGLMISAIWRLPLALDLAGVSFGANLRKVPGLLLACFLYGATWRQVRWTGGIGLPAHCRRCHAGGAARRSGTG